MWWLLETSVRQALEQACKFGVMPTAEQQIQFEARHSDMLSGNSSRIMSIAGNSAEISINGIITQSPNLMAMLFGGGNITYPEIISAIAEAEQDDSIDNITLSIDSPGGEFAGLFDALASIQTAKKPIKAIGSNLVASAAYAIASQADEIIASNRAVRIGSIGVAASFQIDENEVTITSRDAPKKRPDLTTETGKSMVREELDSMHELFVEAIASGRNVTVEKINVDFGQGGTLLSDKALKNGMIDGIAGTKLQSIKTTKQTTASGGNQPEAMTMDLSTLKAEHPDVFAKAVQQGVSQERDRVVAHLTMGEGSGDMKTAVTSIKDGVEMTSTMNAVYLSAGMNRQDTVDRQTDDASASAADAIDSSGSDDATDAVANLVESKLGL